MAFALVKMTIRPVTVGRPAIVVFAPWVSGRDAIARASVGAKLLARGGAPFAVTVVPEQADYAARIADQGAWLVSSLARQAGCGYRERAP